MFAAKTLLERLLLKRDNEYTGEAELLVYAFTDPAKETSFYFPSFANLEGIKRANNRISMLRKGFEASYDNLQVLGAEQLDRPKELQSQSSVSVFNIKIGIEAFAYGTITTSCDGTKQASLIIPGSGLNQSLGIATGDKNNYHYGVLQALSAGGKDNIYTFIKPNEDFLAQRWEG